MTNTKVKYEANNRFLRTIINSLDALKSTPYRKINRESSNTLALNTSSFEKIRQAARHLDNNSSLASAVVTYLVNNIVGAKGVQVEPLPLTLDGDVDSQLAKQISMLWSLFLRNAEVRGNNFAQTQRLACTHYLLDGEIFAQKILYRDKEIGNDYPFILQLITGDQVPNITIEAERIHSGIKLNRWNRAKAYYFDTEGGLFHSSLDKLMKVDADQIIHARNRRRIDDLRGMSVLARAIPSIQDLKDYEEAEMIAAKQLASLVLAVVKDDIGGDLTPDYSSYDLDEEGEELLDELEKKYLEVSRANETAELEVRPGTVVMNLKPGEDIRPIEASRSNSHFKMYRSETIKNVAAATGSNYSTIAKDYSGTYSSQRQELIETWQNIAPMQNEFASQFIEPVYRAFIKNCIAYGHIKPKGELFLIDNAQYTHPVMPWIDPVKEVQAHALSNQAGFTSKQETIRAQGRNPEDTFTQLEEEENRGLGRPKTIADVQSKQYEEETENEQNT